LVLELDNTALRREFEERLAECGTLAFRVARGVLRNGADAEDVAQEALLQAYRRFDRLRDRSRFRAWLVRITFRLALDQARTSRRREQPETLWAVAAPRPTAEDLAASSEFVRRLDDWRRPWKPFRKSPGWFFGCQRWTVIRSKKWQSCSKWKSRSTS